jgi:hypothetical protein
MTTVEDVIRLLEPHRANDKVAKEVSKTLDRFSYGTPLSQEITTLEQAKALTQFEMRDNVVVVG